MAITWQSLELLGFYNLTTFIAPHLCGDELGVFKQVKNSTGILGF